ncbi:MAG: bifunctional diaminohydroxyphosphoribosylaminopyrimidine deaminase/5-amino-6-(5-phosphoribosylamino)uracil reductase RibD [Pseudomonadota bacterium]
MHPTPHNSDQDWMQRALMLAREVRGHVYPNPPVGCVIVKDGDVVAEAATHPGGRPHAERKALDMAGFLAKGATLYVTLEPCCHWGQTPPCSDAIIDAGIARVVCAVQDPDPRVNGGGFAALLGAGIDLKTGVCRDEAKAVLSGFLHRIQFGAPEIIESAESPGLIPQGADAVLASGTQEVVLTTRTGTIKGELRSQDQLLYWMAELGLTTVAIPQQDAFWTQDQIRQTSSDCDNGSTAKLQLLNGR